MAHEENPRLAVGAVVATHGLKGDLKIRPYGTRADLLFDTQSVFVQHQDETSSGLYVVERVAPHKKGVLLRLQGLTDIEAVKHLIGCEILIDINEAGADDDNEPSVYRLIGKRVVDRRRGELGILQEVFSTAAHDILVVEGPFGEVLIPAVANFMMETSPAEERIFVDLPEGLVPEIDEV
jgi:16S rRNA processing protein RimM